MEFSIIWFSPHLRDIAIMSCTHARVHIKSSGCLVGGGTHRLRREELSQNCVAAFRNLRKAIPFVLCIFGRTLAVWLHTHTYSDLQEKPYRKVDRFLFLRTFRGCTKVIIFWTGVPSRTLNLNHWTDFHALSSLHHSPAHQKKQMKKKWVVCQYFNVSLSLKQFRFCVCPVCVMNYKKKCLVTGHSSYKLEYGFLGNLLSSATLNLCCVFYKKQTRVQPNMFILLEFLYHYLLLDKYSPWDVRVYFIDSVLLFLADHPLYFIKFFHSNLVFCDRTNEHKVHRCILSPFIILLQYCMRHMKFILSEWPVVFSLLRRRLQLVAHEM